MRFRRAFSDLALVLLCLAGNARAADSQGALRLSAGGGYDSNLLHEYQELHNTLGDAFGSLLLDGQGALSGEAGRLLGAYTVAGRNYFNHVNDDILVQSASMESTLRLQTPFAAGLSGQIKDRRGGDRAYSFLTGGPFLDYVPDRNLELRVELAAQRFIYRPSLDDSYGAPLAKFRVRYRLSPRHLLILLGDAGTRQYLGHVNGRAGEVRKDTVLEAGVAYAYRGPFTASGGYTYFEEDSNSHGESLQRHLLWATAGVKLPFELFLLANAQMQFNHYPQGISAGTVLPIGTEDEESHPSLSVRISHPLTSQLDVEAQGAQYFDSLKYANTAIGSATTAVTPHTYFRTVVSAGFTWRM